MKKETLLAVMGIALSGLAAQGATLYQNNTTPTAFQYGVNAEFGDQIILANPANNVIQGFSFRYYTQGTLSGDEQIQLRFYQNDGTQVNGVQSPGSRLYESGFFPIVSTAGGPGGSLELNYEIPNINVPQVFTWTVEFSGLTGTEAAGLFVYNPPTVGGNFNDYWQRTSSDNTSAWILAEALNGTPMNFNATVTGVPEPGTVALMVLGGISCLVAARNRKKVD